MKSVLSRSDVLNAVDNVVGIFRREGPEGITQRYRVYHNERNGIHMFTYLKSMIAVSDWAPEEMVCRGLMLNDDGGIVAMPFEKFFNLGEVDFGLWEYGPIEVSQKIDGSLGIVYKDADGWSVATKGGFDNDHALWATERLRNCPDLDFYNGITLLLEIVWEGNRNVARHEDGLYLLGARWWSTGEITLPCEAIKSGWCDDFKHIRRTTISDPENLSYMMGKLEEEREEGLVCRTKLGHTVKVKTDWYVQAHRALWSVGSITPRNIAKHILDDVADDVLSIMPPHMKEEYSNMLAHVMYVAEALADAIVETTELWQYDSRKEYAMLVKSEMPPQLHHPCFVWLNKDRGKLVRSIIEQIARHGELQL